MLHLQHSSWRVHDQDFDRSDLDFQRTDGLNVIETYKTVSLIDQGAFGVVYSAIASSQSTGDPLQRPTHILKIFRKDTGLTPDQMFYEAKAEYYATTVLDRIAKFKKEDMCRVRAICAQAVFKDPLNNVILTFEFEDGDSLFRFTQVELYPSYSKDPREYRKQVFKIGYMLCDIVKTLNKMGVYHRDIKPANILVSRNKNKLLPVPDIQSLKLIDFGRTCIARNEIGVALRMYDNFDIVSALDCADTNNKYFYDTTYPYRDPQAGSGFGNPKFRVSVKFDRYVELQKFPVGVPYDVIYDQTDVADMWPKFEAFSCATTIQTLVYANYDYQSVISIIASERSTSKLYNALRMITLSEWKNRISLSDLHDFLKRQYNEITNTPTGK